MLAHTQVFLKFLISRVRLGLIPKIVSKILALYFKQLYLWLQWSKALQWSKTLPRPSNPLQSLVLSTSTDNVLLMKRSEHAYMYSSLNNNDSLKEKTLAQKSFQFWLYADSENKYYHGTLVDYCTISISKSGHIHCKLLWRIFCVNY